MIGILRTREYLLYRAMDEYKPLRTILHTPNFVPETVRTDVLFRSMQQKKNHIAIVVDEYGGVSGLVSMEDLLEEIVGNIYDEYDPQVEQAVTKVGDNLWRVSRHLRAQRPLRGTGHRPSPGRGLRHAQRSGLLPALLHPAGRLPSGAGRAGLHIYVEEISDHRVEWAQVSKNLSRGRGRIGCRGGKIRFLNLPAQQTGAAPPPQNGEGAALFLLQWG